MYRIRITLFSLILIIVSSCSAMNPLETTNNTTDDSNGVVSGAIPQEIRNIKTLGEPYKEIITQIVTTNNCDGHSPTTNIARSLSTEKVVTFEVQTSAGSIVKGAPIPQILEAQLEAQIQASLAKSLGQTLQQEISFDLITDDGTANEHTVFWREVKVSGALEVVFPDGVAELFFQKIIGIELSNRTSVPIMCENQSNTSPSSGSPDVSPTSPVETALPSPTPEPVVIEVTAPQRFFVEDHIPDGSSMTITVNGGEVHAMTSGTICVADVCLPGGTDRGSVVIFLPTATYKVTELTPTWNWHGAYYATSDQWEIIADKLVREQKIPGTCSDGDGCSIVDVVVVGPNGIIAQYQD